jgi:hypothetical protein
MGPHDILLDRDVRDWVLIPLTLSIILMMLIRQYATQVLPARNMHLCRLQLDIIFLNARTLLIVQAFGGSPPQKVDLKEVREKQALTRSQMLRGAYGFIPEGAFRQRKTYFAAKVRPSLLLSGVPGVLLDSNPLFLP